MTRAARHGNPQSRSPRRSSTNPASVALAVVGVGLLVGFFAILAGTGRRSARLDEPPKEAQPQDMDADLMPRIAALKNFTGAPEEGIRRVDALYAQASRAPAQKELLALRQKFIEAKARKDLDAFRSLKVSLLTSARDGHFAAAYRGIEDFKAAHELVLKGDAGIARLFQEEIATVTQQIEAAREALEIISQKN